jgi:hypothetical protein
MGLPFASATAALASSVPLVMAKAAKDLSTSSDDSAFPFVSAFFVLGTAMAIPLLAQRINTIVASGSTNSNIYRIFWAGAFVVNLITVSLPGRFDSNSSVQTKGVATFQPVFAPAPFAFAIWGVIYLGELIMSCAVAFQGHKLPSNIRKATAFWVSANLYQSLWCIAFRPKFRNALWIPTSLLAAGAVALLFCHQKLMEVVKDSGSVVTIAKAAKYLFAAPVSLHLGWLSAATLLNVNAWASECKISLGKNISLAFFSTYLATFIGAAITLATRDPLVACTIAWALAAIAYQTNVTTNNRTNYLEPHVKESLSFTEKSCSNALLILAAIAPFITIIRNSHVLQSVKEKIF